MGFFNQEQYICKYLEITGLQKDDPMNTFAKKLCVCFVIEKEMSTSLIGKSFVEILMDEFF